jgi:hypothetical protein
MSEKYLNFLISIPPINSKVSENLKIEKSEPGISIITQNLIKIRAVFGNIKKEVEDLSDVKNVEDYKNQVLNVLDEIKTEDVEDESDVEDKSIQIRDCRVMLIDIFKQKSKVNLKCEKNSKPIEENKKNIQESEILLNPKLEKTFESSRRFICKFCNQKFTLKCLLSIHIKIHKKRSKKCNFTPKNSNFKSKNSLESQKDLKHQSTEPASLTLQPSLNLPILDSKSSQADIPTTNNEAQNSQCKICLKIFKTKNYLKHHERIHDKKCFKCKKKFISNLNLKRHEKVGCKNVKNHLKCLECNYTTGNKYNFKTHQLCHKIRKNATITKVSDS